ncbi:rhodanese-like domain-containing protein [Methylococcus sp. EFPC2]|nr:rhodanese-like domain-containing protein [Methylococcus sp. EFPC2]
MDRIGEFVGNHWILSSGWFVVSLLLIQDSFDVLTRKYKSTTPADAVALLNDDETLVIDVRDPAEFATGHIVKARNILYAKVGDKLGELEPYKNKTIIVCCQQGTKSGPTCKKLAKAGFTQVHDLRGGLLAWEDAKLPLTRKS